MTNAEATTDFESKKAQPKSVSLTWDLDSLFPGGAGGSTFSAFRSELKSMIEQADTQLNKLPKTLNSDSATTWEEFIMLVQGIAARLEQGGAFAGCLISASVSDALAGQAHGEINDLRGLFLKSMTGFEALTADAADAEWNSFVERPALRPVAFPLNEMRKEAQIKMSPELEALTEELAVNGYHAWDHLYTKMAGELTVQWEENGETSKISLGQLATKFNNADREIRAKAFAKLTKAWKSRESLAAMALNNQAGFRLTLYERRGWKSPTDEPLRMNRMTRATVDAMWSAVNEAKPKLAQYLDAKKKLLGIDGFRWYDESAPIGSSSAEFSWDEAWDFVIKNVGDFSPDMKTFCEMARDKRWVEGEDRPDKAGGGFCTSFPLNKESRIFMTFGNTYGDLSTLAHELGHAYHSHVLKDREFFATQYPMNLAETASTFNELLIIDAALKQSSDKQEKLMLLDQKMQSALTFFCNIQTRFIFDETFYAARAKGALTSQELGELMTSAQRKAYGDLLTNDGLHPLFWAAKLHFFFTDVPFYNFPYTFGFLFATGVYAHAQKQGSSFAQGYSDMLADTGSMMAEEVAQKHLGVDLTKVDFWRSAVNGALEGLDEFVELARG